MATSTLKQIINPPNVARIVKKELPESDTWTTVTSEGGWYLAASINRGTSGACLAYITNTASTVYYASAYNLTGSYRRAVTPWIYFPKGTQFRYTIARAASDSDTSGLFFAPPL